MFTQTPMGFQMKLKNQWTVSVTWFPGSHSDIVSLHVASNVEVALLSPSGELEGDPRGYVTPEELLTILVETALR